MEPFSTIVAAVDFSDTSSDVVEAALRLARHSGFNGHVRLLHAVPHVVQAPWAAEAPGLDIDDMQRQWVAAAIVGYANERAADAIVVGSHGRGVIRRFLLGTVAERVLRDASCPVLVVPDRSLRDARAEVRSVRAAGRRGHAA